MNNETVKGQEVNLEGQELERQEEAYTKEEFEKKLQSETDKRVTEALKTAKEKWENEKQQELERTKTEAEKLARMTAQEKVEAERDKLKAELENLRLKDTLNEMAKTARTMLSGAEISVDDKLLGVLVKPEAEETKNNVEAFIKSFNESLNKSIQEKLKSKTPVKGGENGLTKNDILGIKDANARIEAIRQNIDLFKGE